ncbi:hypothetical protein GJ496_004306 [Pomphorhynchus laevis]|nr:hypothetical protein GJ496_004306 [Pomphorhynchus laevis]
MPGRGRRRNSCKVVTAGGDNNDLSRKTAKTGRAGVTTRASASSSVTLATSSRQAHSLPPLLPTLPRVAAELDSSPLYPVQESNSSTKRHLTSPPVDESQVRQQLSSTDSSPSVSSKKKRSVMNLEDSLSRYFTTKSEKRSVRIPTKFDEMLLIDCAASSSSNNSKPYHNGLGNNVISGKTRLPTDSSMSLNGRRGKRTAAPTTTATSTNRKRSSTNVADSSSRHRSSSVCCDQRLHRRRGERKASSRFDPSKIAVATTTAITDISNKATKKGKTRGVISDGGTLKEHGLTSRRRGRRSKAAITTTPLPNVLHFTSSYRQHHHNQEQQQQSTRRHTSAIASSHHLRSAVFANTNFAVANIDAASTTTIDTNIMTSPLADRRLTLSFEDRINFKKRRPRPRPTPPVLSRSLRLAARQLSSSVKFLPSKNEKEIINPLTSVDFYSESVPVNAVAHKCSVDKTTSSYRSGVNTRSSNCKLTIMYSSPDTKRKPRRTDNASTVAATANIRRRRRYRRNKKTTIKKEGASTSRQTTTIVTRNSKARALSYSFNSLPTTAAPSVTVTPHSIQSVSIAEQSNEAVDLPAVTSYLPSLRSSRSSTCILPKQLVSPSQKSIKHEINCDDFQQDFINKEHISFPVNIDNQLKVDRSTSFQDSQQLVPAYLNQLNNQFSTCSDNDDNRFIVDDADLNHVVPNSQLSSLRFSSVECLETKLPADSNEALQVTQSSTDALTEPIVIKSTTSGRYNKFRAAKGLRNNTATTIRDEQQHIGHRSKRVLSGTASTNDSITLTTNIYQHDDGGECCTFKSVSYRKKGRTAARHHGTASRITRASVFLDKAAEQLKEQINREILTNNIPLDMKKDSKTCCNKSKCMESVPVVANRNRSPINSSNEREQHTLLGVCGHASTTDIQLDHIKSIKNDIQNSVDKPKKKLGRPRKVVPVDPITPDLMNQPTFGNYATPMKPIRSVKKNMKLSQCNDGSNDYRCAQIKLEATQQHSISEECTGKKV